MSNKHWYVVTWVFAGLITAMGHPVESAQRFKWWASDEVRLELALTDTQSADLEAIFQAIRPKLRELMQRLEREEDELAALMHAMQAEEWEVALQIDKVEAARSALGKTRTLMLYRMHKQLTPEQLDGLHAMWERGAEADDSRDAADR